MYTKIYACLLDSSVWQQSAETRVVWLTLLLMMDEDGVVRMGSISALARRANLPDSSTRKALDFLEMPDPESEDQEGQGVRIQRIEGGWLIVKGAEYRAMKTRMDVRQQNRIRQQKHRARKRDQQLQLGDCDNRDERDSNTDVTPVTKSHTSEQNRTKEKNTPPQEKEDSNVFSRNGSRGPAVVPEFAEIPSLEEVQGWNDINLGAEAKWLEAAYHEAVSVGWLDWKQRRIVMWKSYFTGVWRSKENRRHEGGSNQRGGDKGQTKKEGGGRGAASIAYSLREKLSGIESQRGDLKGKRDRLTSGPMASDDERAQRKQLSDQIKELKSKESDIKRRLADLEIPE